MAHSTLLTVSGIDPMVNATAFALARNKMTKMALKLGFATRPLHHYVVPLPRFAGEDLRFIV